MNPPTRKEPLLAVKTDEVVLTARLTGGGAATALVNADSALLGGGEVISGAYAGSTGLFNIVFRRKLPEAKCNPLVVVTGTTTGLCGSWVSYDITAATGQLRLFVGNTLTDPATTDSIHLLWVGRDSGKNA